MTINGYRIELWLSSDPSFFCGETTPEDQLIATLHEWVDVGTLLEEPRPEYATYPYGASEDSPAMQAYREYDKGRRRHIGVRRAIATAVESFPLVGREHMFWAGESAEKDYGYYCICRRVDA